MPQPTDKSSNLQPDDPRILNGRKPNHRTEETVDNNTNKIFIRLPSSYIPFFQAMAEDYYRRNKISKPSVGLLTKKCLFTAGHSWNRMMVQLKNVDYEREEIEQERRQYLTPTSEYQQQRQDRERRVEQDLKKARIISEHFRDEF